MMRMRSPILVLALLCLFLTPETVVAQDSESFQETFLRQFNSSARKFMALAEAMPAEAYNWSPGDGVMSLENIYMHITHYNYNYLHTYLGADLPDGIDLDALEEIKGKDDVMKHMKASMDYVREMTKEISQVWAGSFPDAVPPHHTMVSTDPPAQAQPEWAEMIHTLSLVPEPAG